MNKQVYIPSIEASDLYTHMIRDKEIKFDYCGMIPYSLELIKLRKEGLNIIKNKLSDKEFSGDVVNVKFNQKVQSGIQLVKKLKDKADSATNDEYRDKLEEFIEYIQQDKDVDKWLEVSPNRLRINLYTKGFYIRNIDEKTGEIIDTKYIVYKRSSSKSRTGQCLFIKEELHKNMIEWSRLNLPFQNGQEIDYASLLAYESLVGSSLERTIKIEPKNILIVDDVESKFKKLCNVVKKGEDGLLDSIEEENEISNSLFDGESLLDSSYFTNNQSMMLLRNHMFKSASFNCNIHEFLIDHCPSDVEFSDWKIKNMFNQSILASDVKLIITPSSLKALKFYKVLGTEKELWNHWKKIIIQDGCLFGVCKHEKKSKRGVDDKGNTLQQMSYQMINSLPIDEDDIQTLSSFELNYIEKLKNDDNHFIDHINKRANDMNSNLMFVELYNINKKIVHTKLFKTFRKAEINSYVTHIKRGKLRLTGDYCVMLGNPIEFLYHSIGCLNTVDCSIKHDKYNSDTLTANEVYTYLFDFDKKITGFRNPHTSPSNVLIATNKYSKTIDTYFNLSPNIVCVNAINFEIQDILSGCDYDSDTVLLLDNEFLLELSEKCFSKYKVCVNKVESMKKKHRLNNFDMCEIDNQLSTSQRNIGKVVNLGQFCMSTYWESLYLDRDKKVLDKLLKKVDILTVLSGICIDLAKKLYELDIDKEITNISKIEELGKLKPMFWKYISQNKNIDKRIRYYQCPMDYLYKEMSELDYAAHRENINISSLLVKYNGRKANRKQESKIIEQTEELSRKIISIMSSSKYTSDEKNRLVDDILKFYEFKIRKLTVKSETMYDMLTNVLTNKSKILIRLLNILYKTQPETFKKAFKMC